MDWIDRTARVPDDRREVHVWGRSGWNALRGIRELNYLGVSRCNVGRDGSRFDLERSGYMTPGNTVTHWAEITGPEVLK